MWVNKSKQLLWFYDEIFLYYFSGGRRKRNVVGKVVKAHTLEEYIKVSVHQQHPFFIPLSPRESSAQKSAFHDYDEEETRVKSKQ